MNMEYNNDSNCFCRISEDELVNVKAGGIGLCIIGTIGGTLTGGLTGAAITIPSPGVGAVIGGIGGGISGGIEGWKK